jgi:antitoxin component of RelBE/YafQ-DinJ toxin-antitoxin module
MKKQDAGLRLRVERRLREEFVDACRADGIPAAQVLRTFMRQYVQEKTAQQHLFSQQGTSSPQGR